MSLQTLLANSSFADCLLEHGVVLACLAFFIHIDFGSRMDLHWEVLVGVTNITNGVHRSLSSMFKSYLFLKRVNDHLFYLTKSFMFLLLGRIMCIVHCKFLTCLAESSETFIQFKNAIGETGIPSAAYMLIHY